MFYSPKKFEVGLLKEIKRPKWKCPICKKEAEWKGVCYKCRYSMNPHIIEKIEAHKIKLESRRKYYKGEFIKTFDELMNEKLVYMWDKIRHIEMIKHLQYSIIITFVNRGYFCKAIKKDLKDKK